MKPTFRTSGTPNYLFFTREIEGVVACWIHSYLVVFSSTIRLSSLSSSE